MTTVPYYRPDITEVEVDEVVATIRSGWLTTGPRVKQFEAEFAAAVGAKHAVAMNSCTAALHLSVHSLGLQQNQAVLVPTLTFAATAEVVRYEGGIPVLVDCDPRTLNMDLRDASQKLEAIRRGAPLAGVPSGTHVVGVIPVHVGGFMMNLDELRTFASRNDLWIVEDAAHAFPSAWRRSDSEPWIRCGQQTAAVSCFSFYANKTITTGEGGMAVTDDADLAKRLRLMSLHGLSDDAWDRYSGKGSWDYRIVAPGYKYNMTDVAAAIGIHQLARAEEMRRAREGVAQAYHHGLAGIDEIELPPTDADRINSFHLFPVKLRLNSLNIDRDQFIDEMRIEGVSCSVHWRPLHLHPYYEQAFGWRPEDLPVASSEWKRLVSLPIFSAMTSEQVIAVASALKQICLRSSRRRTVSAH